MLKWSGLLLIVLAFAVRLFWHSTVDFAFRVSSTTHRGYPAEFLAFWALLILGVTMSIFGFAGHLSR